MKTFIKLFFFIFFLLPSNNILADIEKGNWNFVKENDYCYISSLPVNSDIPEGKKRGDVYILVYRINNDPETIIQINSGYPYKNEESVNVKIDKKNYEFYADEDSAWTNDDKEVVFAMKKGVKLTVSGVSSRGTKTVDTYTLNGFTVALNKLTKDC
jgi:hypothetical protein|tara:strand:+ start:885 stop:1352 length:468 start_codon:yes stop_codon:yes gene_type:complete